MTSLLVPRQHGGGSHQIHLQGVREEGTRLPYGKGVGWDKESNKTAIGRVQGEKLGLAQ